MVNGPRAGRGHGLPAALDHVALPLDMDAGGVAEVHGPVALAHVGQRRWDAVRGVVDRQGEAERGRQ